jgi:hypothetical protein
MLKLDLCSIVEGKKGERFAVPILLRRLRDLIAPTLDLRIHRPIFVPRNKITKTQELERAMELAARQSLEPRAIFILLDADDDPPCILGPQLLEKARQIRPDIPSGVVLANREYEAWFLAALPSLAGRRGIADHPDIIDDPEKNRDPKGILRRFMTGIGSYSPVVDQPALTALFDLEMARKQAPSFDKCWRVVENLFQTVF